VLPTSANVKVTFNNNNISKSSAGADVALFCGQFEQGPVDTPVYVTNVNEFIYTFGEGTGQYFNDWLQVWNYLQYSSTLWVVRSSALYVNSNNGPDVIINTPDDFNTLHPNMLASPSRFIAKTPGKWGDDLEVAIIGKSHYDVNADIGYNTLAQNTFTFFEVGYFGICVFYKGKLVESFYKLPQDLETLNVESTQVYVKSTPPIYATPTDVFILGTTYGVLDMGTLVPTTAVDSFGTLGPSQGATDLAGIPPLDPWFIYYALGPTIIKLTNGYDQPIDITSLTNSYNLFDNKDTQEIDIVIGNEVDNNSAISLAATRGDSVAFVGVPTELINKLNLLIAGNPHPVTTPTHNVLVNSIFRIPEKMTDTIMTELERYVNTLQRSSFCNFTMNIKMQPNRYTGKQMLVNIAGDVAGLKSHASVKTPWTPGAGLENGTIRNATKLYMDLTQIQQDRMFLLGTNTTEHNTIISQKTFSSVDTVYRRTHVRCLINRITRESNKILRNFLFDNLSVRSTELVRSSLSMYLNNIQHGRGITAWDVQSHINGNVLSVSILVNPTFVVEQVSVNFTNVGTKLFTQVV